MEKIFIVLNELSEKLDKLVLNSKEYLCLQAAATYLNISKSTLYKHTSAGAITFYRPHGKLIFFKKEDLIKWMEKNKVDNNLN